MLATRLKFSFATGRPWISLLNPQEGRLIAFVCGVLEAIEAAAYRQLFIATTDGAWREPLFLTNT